MSIIINKAKQIVLYFLSLWWRFKYPHISSTTRLGSSIWVFARKNLYMDENTNLSKGTVIMNTRAKFIMKKNSGAAIGLLAITGNHLTVPGVWFKQVTDTVKAELDVHNELDRDIIVEEDVWIGANVTLLSGVHVGRGCIVGAGSVLRSNTPPYAILTGNPAKIVGFRFAPKECVKHEQELYSEEERIPLEVLEKNYYKYYINRIKEIKDFVRL